MGTVTTNTKQDREARGKTEWGIRWRNGMAEKPDFGTSSRTWLGQAKVCRCRTTISTAAHRVRAEPVSLLFETKRVVMQPGMNALQEDSRDDGGLGSDTALEGGARCPKGIGPHT
jgi:phage terminase large subunit-like protein